MPKNRIIPFGYCMKNGEIITESKELYAVVTIFNEYLKGKSLSEIAALMEVPYSENSSWNKNMVKRIIENDRYLGTEKYPQIIDKETFKLANEKRVRKATVSIGQTEEVKLLKQITFCKECGQKLTRTKENLWDCRRPECYRFDHLLTDQMILSAVLNVFNTVIANPTLINSDCTVSTYSPNAKVRFQQNEINRMTEFEKYSFVSPMITFLSAMIAIRFGIIINAFVISARSQIGSSDKNGASAIAAM